jgi:hypothetical protein
MIALPLWGHTVKWYSKPFKKGEALRAPPFKDLPQHDWDHNGGKSYREEVEKSLTQIASDISDSMDVHKVNPADIKAQLNTTARGFRSALKARGKRNKGTHRQFKAELAKDAGLRMDWYKPFSMSSFASTKGYPAQHFQDEVKKKVKSFFR